MGDRLCQFLVLDNRARHRAFMIAASLSITAGTMAFVGGLSERDALIMVSVLSVAIFSYLGLRYAMAPTFRVPQRVPGRQDRARLLWIQLGLVGAADWVIAALVGSPAPAIAFANTARQALKENRGISTINVDLSKALIMSHLPRSSQPLRTQLLSARAVLSSAQVYSSVKSSVASNKPYISKHPDPESIRQLLNRPLMWVGASRSGSTLEFVGGSQPKLLVRHDLIIDTMTLEAVRVQPPERPPVLFQLQGGVQVFLKNCTIRYVTQNLSRVACFNVLFESCSVDLRGPEVVLVDVSFRNCDISCTQATKREFPQLLTGNGTNITTEV